METKLQAIIRDKQTKGDLGKQGLIPAILYGHNIENVKLAISKKDFDKALKAVGESSILTLELESGKKGDKRPVLVHDIQYGLISHEPTHVDFYQVKLDEKIKAHVALEFIGESSAVKNFGGILNKSVFEIEVEALPNDLPHNIEVDLSKLEVIDSSIYLKDLSIPKGVKLLESPETVVATVTPPRSEEEIAATKEAVVEKVDEVKVEVDEKKADREQEKQKKEGE